VGIGKPVKDSANGGRGAEPDFKSESIRFISQEELVGELGNACLVVNMKRDEADSIQFRCQERFCD